MRIILAIAILLCSAKSTAQEVGMPFYRHYEPKEYQGHRQNWAIAQDDQGVMYFANEGLLAFNGEDWHLEMVPNQRHLRSLDTGHGRIYVGGNNELGFFEKIGDKYVFTSHVSHVPDSLKNFDRVWTTLVFKESVFYQTDTFVLRVSMDGTSKLWEFTKDSVWKLLLMNEVIHIDVPTKGFFALHNNDEFRLVPNGDSLTFVGMEFFLPIKNGRLFEQKDVLKVFDGKQVSVFENDASDIFLEYGLDSGLKTSSGLFVFATRRKGGVVILDENGNLKHHFTSENGFSNEIVRNVFEDREGSIWFALNAGISRLDLSSPLRYYTSKTGLSGTTFAIQRFNKKLYAGTTDGLKVMGEDGFTHVGEITSLIQDLDTVQNHLIVATSRDSMYAIDAAENISKIDIRNMGSKGINLQILVPLENTESFISLFEEGIFQVVWDGDKWRTKERVFGHFKDASEMIQPKLGEVWVDTGVNGVYRITYVMGENGVFNFDNATVKRYYLDSGVPKGSNTLFNLESKVILRSTMSGTLYAYDSEKDVFSKIDDLSWFNGLQDSVITSLSRKGRVFPDKKWFHLERGSQNFLIHSIKDGSVHKNETFPLNMYAASFGDPRGFNTFYPEEDRVFFGGIRGLLEYRINEEQKTNRDIHVQITQVATSDTTYFNNTIDKILPDIRYNNNKLSFEFVSTSFKDAENKKYQYKLEGFDDEWSEPSLQNKKEYTSLPSGDYTFKVKALNDYYMSSPEASVSFIVNRPWYWNSISIASYILLIGLLTFLISQWRNRNLKQKNLRLEEAVNKAVAETQRQADEIAHLYEIKNQFFSNISHELRTPLTLILGPSTDLLENQSLDIGQKNKLTFINNNAKRLLRLINQLLDLSKLEAGKLDLRARQQNIVKLASTITESFSSMATSRGISLTFESNENSLYVFYDPDKLEKVLINLLSNAMKFTKKGGRVVVVVSKLDNTCQIVVEDNGIGINSEQLPYVFDRFFQADNRESREHEGTGIGLSLTKELIELHQGSITVVSEQDLGSTVTVTLPFGKEHIEERQLVKFNTGQAPVGKFIEEPIGLERQETNLEELEQGEIILVVEDNAEMRAYIINQIENDYQIIEAENGLVGLEKAKEHVPDLILSDVMMPIMDGTELCKHIKNDDATSHIPVVLLTAKASEEDKIKGLNIQADAYLAKPFNKLELHAQIKNLILNRKKLQKRFANTTLISPKDIAVTSMEQQFLEKLLEKIEENLGDEGFGVEQLADFMHLSRSQLHRKMISITDQPPSLFIRKYRLERAKILLEKGAARISDIAFQVGFSSPSYFTKCFVEEFGKTPKEASR